MTAYIVRRLLTAVVVVVGIALLTFVMIHVVAPSPGRAVLGDKASALAVAYWNKTHGYDRPIWDQFVTYLHQLVQGNLGYSYKLNQTVDSLIGENWARTAYLCGIAIFLAVVLAIPLGILQAVRRNTFLDQSLTAGAFTAYSMPDNFLGLLLIGVLALQLHWFPAEASQSESIWQNILNIRAMFLPIVTLASTSIAGYSRYMRSSALDALAQDYIRLARAKGLSERRVLSRHLFRNASLAMVTLVGLSIPALIGGDVIEEYLFNFHGLGLLFVNELNNEDFSTVIALVLIGGVLTVVGNLIADVALCVADPRIRIA
ncbi:MAG: ABC transporter permease [Acidimicrobiales bacterium]